MWAFTIVLALGAALGGYIIGLNEGRDQATAASQAPQPTAGQPTNGQAGEHASQPADISDVQPGTDFNGDNATDATLYGAGDDGEVGRRNADDAMAMGAVDAPIVISEFSSFGCPYCARHNNETEQRIVEEYVETGLVRLEWNDFPINGPNSEDAARAGRAAAEQGKFFEFKDALFAEFEARAAASSRRRTSSATQRRLVSQTWTSSRPTPPAISTTRPSPARASSALSWGSTGHQAL